VRLGSESAMESRCRLLFARSSLPEPELNAVLYDRRGGFLGRADFLWRRRRVIAEYQGEDHFTTFERGDDDISRRLLFEDDGWKYVEITKRDYVNPGRRHQLVSRLSRYLLEP
jgi:very-short-patch-repair endonuclease